MCSCRAWIKICTKPIVEKRLLSNAEARNKKETRGGDGVWKKLAVESSRQ